MKKDQKLLKEELKTLPGFMRILNGENSLGFFLGNMTKELLDSLTVPQVNDLMDSVFRIYKSFYKNNREMKADVFHFVIEVLRQDAPFYPLTIMDWRVREIMEWSQHLKSLGKDFGFTDEVINEAKEAVRLLRLKNTE